MSFSIDMHLDGKLPIVKVIFDDLIAGLSHLDQMEILPRKTAIQLSTTFAFASLCPRVNYLLVHFYLDRKIENGRLVKVEQISRHRYKHSLNLTSPNEVDEQLIEWIEEAHALKA